MSQSDANPNSSGFSLPAPSSSGGETSSITTVTTSQQSANDSLINAALAQDTSSRDLLIGGGILLVLLIAFFFAKGAFANTLVAKRVPPNKANAAGWWLFICLASISTGVVLSAVSAVKFMTPLVLGPLVGFGVLALVLAIVSSRK